MSKFHNYRVVVRLPDEGSSALRRRGYGPSWPSQVGSVGRLRGRTPSAEQQAAEEESPRGLIQPRVVPPHEARTSVPPLWEGRSAAKGEISQSKPSYGVKAWSRGSAVCNRLYMNFYEEPTINGLTAEAYGLLYQVLVLVPINCLHDNRTTDVRYRVVVLHC